MRKPIGILHLFQFLRLIEEEELGEVTPELEPEPESFFDLDDSLHMLSVDTPIKDTVAWLRYRGYRVVGAYREGVMPGIVFGRKNGPATVAVVGDILEYDGMNVVVME